MEEKKEWRDIPNFEKYEISTHGEIRGKVRGRIKKPQKHTSDYLRIQLYDEESRTQSFQIHQLMGLVFLGPRPSDEHEIDHIDGDKRNNHLSNLRWATRPDNVSAAIERGHLVHATRPVLQMRDGNVVAEFDSIVEASEATGIHRTSISTAAGHGGRAGDFEWEYKYTEEKVDDVEGKFLYESPDYKITKDGRIFSVRARRMLKTYKNTGYEHINLVINGKRTTVNIHRAVAEHYIDNPDNLPEVRHINGDRFDQRVENLEWATHQQTIQAHHDNNTVVYGKRVIQCDLETGEPLRTFNNIAAAFEFLGRSQNGRIGAVCDGRAESAFGYKWKWG